MIGAVGKVACLGVELLVTNLRVGWVLNVLYEQRRSVVCNLMVDDWQWLPEILVMELNKERGFQDHINGSDGNKAILSEHALRELSRSLTVLIPKDVDRLEKSAVAYGSRRQGRCIRLTDYKAN